uniref:non-specific serine/threonine protein kinase n=1 Tax=Chenopodium quinoa TaxID=63459 RepID=A0A803KVC4_CHEQI
MLSEKTRKSVENPHHDKLSSLPDNLIETILMYMSIKEAAKTSILSRQWRYKWTTIPVLNFNLESLNIPIRAVTAIDDQSGVDKYNHIINTVLKQHSGNVQKIKMTIINKKRRNDDLQVPNEFRWIQELILGYNLKISYNLPPFIFSCKSLEVLRLECCIFTSPLSMIALPKLKTLDLRNATFRPSCLESHISQCPLLENLRLYDVEGIVDLTLDAPMLKSCVLKGAFESIHLNNATLLSFLYLCPYRIFRRYLDYFQPLDYFQSFFQLKALRELEVHSESIQNLFAGNCPEARVKNLPELQELTVYEFSPGDLSMVSSLFSLIRSCSNLQYLEIHVKDSISSILPSLENFLKAMGDTPKCFQHVKSIHLVGIYGTMYEMELLKFLLINSPSLGKMIVKSIHKDTCKEHTTLLKDLLSFNRASCTVQIILLSRQCKFCGREGTITMLPKSGCYLTVDYSFGGDKEEQQKLSYDKEQQEKLSDDKEAGEGEITSPAAPYHKIISAAPPCHHQRSSPLAPNPTVKAHQTDKLSCFTVKSCHAIDKEALLDFKHRITYDPSKLLGSWLTTTDCCTAWEGIACDPSNGRVINISRPSAMETFMSGTLSPFLGNLTYLQVLDLSDLSELSGPIPPQLGKLSHLTILFLNNNKLNGSLPSSFSYLHKVKKLCLSRNSLSGTLPYSVFQSWTSILEIDLSENQFLGPIPSSISNMNSLTNLALQYNKLSGRIPYKIGKLKSLTKLLLTSNRITGSIPHSISKLSQLQDLSLNLNRLIGPIPSSIGQLASLLILDLSHNKLTGVLPDSLGNLSKCFYMNIQNNMITGHLPPSLGNLVSLEQLDLSKNQLVGPIPHELNKIKDYLSVLNLSYNPLSLGKIPSWMSKLNNLSYLMLAKTGLKGELPSWLSSSLLVHLDLSSNELTGRLPTWIGNMSDLWYLNISCNKFYSTIPKEFKNLVSITDLDLHSNNFSGPLDFIFDKNVDGPLGHYNSIDVSRNKFTGPIDKNVGNKLAVNTISSLILSNNPLGGRIPKSIGNLTQLRMLEMVRDKLSGTIPEEISNADTLRIINFSRNYLTGRIPKKVINLEWLEEFKVIRNKLSGEIPAHKANFSASAFFGNPGLCGVPLPALESCHAIDKEALLNFKHKITHDPSQLLRTWLPNTDCCTVWEGVDCNPVNGRVVNVSCPGVQSGDDFILDTSMSGTLSPFLGNLTYLQLLDLSNLKELTGPIPPQLGKLSHLTNIFLNTNKLNGSLPSSLSGLIKLKKLYLSQNRLSGIIPNSVLQSLKSISELDLSENQFSGPIPSSVVDLISLTSLTLHDNKLSGKIPFEIGKLKSLKSLHLSLNRISGSIPDSTGKLSKLQDLSLSHNKLTGPIPSSMGKLVSLQALSLSNNRLTGVLPSSIGIKGELPRWFSSSSIGYLDLSNNKLTGKLPTWIGNMSELWFLNISYNEFYSTIPNEFKNLSLLSDLDLHSNKFSGPLDYIFDKNVDEPRGHYNSIDVSSNMFTGPIDKNVGNKLAMDSITSLILSNNPLGGRIPKSVGNLTRLEVLEMELFEWKYSKECDKFGKFDSI